MKIDMITNFKLFEKRVPKSERIKLINDKKYLLVVPLTDNASCKYGAYTKWCTSVPGSGASIEETETNSTEETEKGHKLLYLLQKDYTIIDEAKSDKFSYLYKDFEQTGDYEYLNSSEEGFLKDTLDNLDDGCFNLEKIAFTGGKGETMQIWDKNNINLSDFNYYIDDLGLEEYLIDEILNFF